MNPLHSQPLWLACALAALAVLALAWSFARQRALRLAAELERAQALLTTRDAQLKLAQDELFRRLYEQRELDREKMQFEAQLTEYEKYSALARLALGAAHEINNPLLGILSHLELESKAVADPEERAEIEQCIAGARRISSTLRSLVNYARPGPLVLSRINLSGLVRETLGFLENQPILRNKRVVNQVPANLPALLLDANQMSQVLMNLFLNAAEATPEGGVITISAGKLAYVDSLEIRVSDTGCGIIPEILPHIFEPFFTTKRGKGTGLGLSISQTYVRSHNGDIRVDSVIGHGTTITITLPLRQEELAADEARETEVVN